MGEALLVRKGGGSSKIKNAIIHKRYAIESIEKNEFVAFGDFQPVNLIEKAKAIATGSNDYDVHKLSDTKALRTMTTSSGMSAAVMTVSDNGVSLGTDVVLTTDTTKAKWDVYVVDSSKALLVVFDSSDSKFYYTFLTISGDNITASGFSELFTYGGGSSYASHSFLDIGDNRLCMLITQSKRSSVIILQIQSNNTVEVGTETVFNTDSAAWLYNAVCCFDGTVILIDRKKYNSSYYYPFFYLFSVSDDNQISKKVTKSFTAMLSSYFCENYIAIDDNHFHIHGSEYIYDGSTITQGDTTNSHGKAMVVESFNSEDFVYVLESGTLGEMFYDSTGRHFYDSTYNVSGTYKKAIAFGNNVLLVSSSSISLFPKEACAKPLKVADNMNEINGISAEAISQNSYGKYYTR